MMPLKPEFFAVGLAILMLCGIVVADDLSTNGDGSRNVRLEYSGQVNTPDYVAFRFLLRTIAHRYENDPDFALVMVQDKMRIGAKESAELFLRQIMSTTQDLARSRKVYAMMSLCHDDTNRTKEDLYRSMDLLDDAELTLAKYAYSDFLRSLSSTEAGFFVDWLQDFKVGYSYTAIDHAKHFDERGIDVRIHIEQVCQGYAREQVRETK